MIATWMEDMQGREDVEELLGACVDVRHRVDVELQRFVAQVWGGGTYECMLGRLACYLLRVDGSVRRFRLVAYCGFCMKESFALQRGWAWSSEGYFFHS